MANTFLFNKPNRLRFYQKLNWSMGISALSKQTGLSRQMLYIAKRQVEFHRMFKDSTGLSYRFAKAAMDGLGTFKKDDFKRWCKAIGIAVVK